MDKSKIIFRREEKSDHRKVEELTKKAFWNRHNAGCDEHYLVHVLRDADCFIDELSIVGELDGEIIVHIMYTKAKVVGDDNVEREVLTFGPVSVLPEYQRMGIGKMTVEHSKKLAKELGYSGVLISGDPEIYGKMGFVPAENFKIGTPDNRYATPLQACELVSGAFEGYAGRFFEDKSFDVDADAAKEFDKSFEYMEPKDDLEYHKRFRELLKMNRARE